MACTISKGYKKCKKGVIGLPLFKKGEEIGFIWSSQNIDDKFVIGKVEIVDSRGTFFQSSEPSYDILVDNWNGEPCLFKHIPESSCYKKTN